MECEERTSLLLSLENFKKSSGKTLKGNENINSETRNNSINKKKEEKSGSTGNNENVSSNNETLMIKKKSKLRSGSESSNDSLQKSKMRKKYINNLRSSSQLKTYNKNEKSDRVTSSSSSSSSQNSLPKVHKKKNISRNSSSCSNRSEKISHKTSTNSISETKIENSNKISSISKESMGDPEKTYKKLMNLSAHIKEKKLAKQKMVI